MKASISYQNPRLYNLFLSLVNHGKIDEKYECLSEIIGKNKKVFDLGCGTCLLADYIDESCDYIGWDLNRNFVKNGKIRGLNIFQKDVFEFDDYPKNDVIVICDVLHHIVPKHEFLINEAKKRTNKLIISDPVVSVPGYNLLSKICCCKIYSYYDYLLGDNDGINKLDDRKKWSFKNQEELNFYFHSLGAKEIIFLKGRKQKFIAIF